MTRITIYIVKVFSSQHDTKVNEGENLCLED